MSQDDRPERVLETGVRLTAIAVHTNPTLCGICMPLAATGATAGTLLPCEQAMINELCPEDLNTSATATVAGFQPFQPAHLLLIMQYQ